jgi:hypothetical protein
MKVKGNILLQYSHFSEIVFQIAGENNNNLAKKQKKHFGTFGVWTLILVW